MKPTKNVLIGSLVFLAIALALLLTIYLAQQRQILRGRASTPTGTTFMCLTHPSQTTADCQTPPANFTTTYDPSNPNTTLQLKFKSGSTPITALYVKLIIPAANINAPTITPDVNYDGNTNNNTNGNGPGDRWTQVVFAGTPCGGAICLVGSNYEVKYGIYYDRTNNSIPPTFNNNVFASVNLPVKSSGSINISLDASDSKALAADVGSADVLFTPSPFNLILNAPDTTPPVVTFNNPSPADNAVVNTNAPVTYTYSATDNVTPPANIKYLAQFDNTTCPTSAASYGTATSFTTPTLQKGPHTTTACAIDNNNNVGKLTRTITYTPLTTFDLRVKFAGIPMVATPPVTPPATIQASRVVVQDTVSGTNPHSYKRTYGTNICGVTDTTGPISFTYDSASNSYTGSAAGLALSAGTNYEVIVKGPSHLATKVKTGINLTSAQLGAPVSVDTTALTVRGGDIMKPNPADPNSNIDGQNCVLDGVDLAGITFLFNDLRASTQGHSIRDINQDGFITGEDLALLTNNFISLSVADDQ